jgi:hypothetical protein
VARPPGVTPVTPTLYLSRMEPVRGDLKEIVDWYEAAAFMHHAMDAAVAPIARVPPDPPTAAALDAARRVTEAYRRARADQVSAGVSMWTHIERRHRDFLTALEDRNIAAVQARLGAMFANGLTYGLARLSFDLDRDARYIQLRCTDALRSLAESCGAERVVSLEQQGPAAQRRALQVDLDRLLAETERLTGLDLSCAPIAAAYGCRIGERLINIDSLVHSYTVNRLRELGASPASTIIEIGGGYGCLAELLARAGLRRCAIYDLPWVNAMQGYYLIMALPGCDVRLYGESRGDLAVLPFWRINDLVDASVDYVVNINSLPEMDTAIARDYMTIVARIIRHRFLSINQEGMAPTVGGLQHWVRRMAAEQGTLHCHSRHRWWMEQGYVEEVYGSSRP